MSFVDLLFPQAELEALGNKWHEPAPKRRKLGNGDAQATKQASVAQRRHNSEAGVAQKHHRLSTPTPYLYGRQQESCETTKVRTTKRSNSHTEASSLSMMPTSMQGKHTATSKSCLPSFIEPSILKNYLRHLHPKDSHRYSVSNSISTETYIADEVVSSPGSLVADSTASPASTESCATPAAVCEQFRSGPFGHIFDGMRLTANERDLMEDLLSPTTPQIQENTASKKRKQDDVKIEPAPEDDYGIDQLFLQRMFPTSKNNERTAFGANLTGYIDPAEECDVHSSGLSPAIEDAEAEEGLTSHRGIVIYDYDTVSVDDFFDLEEASTEL